MLAASKVKICRSEKIKANMSTGNKIFGQHIRQFLLKKKSVTRKIDVLVIQNGIVDFDSTTQHQQTKRNGK